MQFTQRLKKKVASGAEKEEEVPKKKKIENKIKDLMEDGRLSELSGLLHSWYLQVYLAGKKSETIKGTKRDKVYMLTLLNTVATIFLVGVIVMFQFYM